MDEQLVVLAHEIYRIVDGADHKQHRAEVVQRIYEWLVNGNTEGRTADDLAEEWAEYDS